MQMEKKKEVGRKAQINKCVFGVTQTKDSQEIAMSLLSVCVCPYQVGNTSFPPPPHFSVCLDLRIILGKQW